MDFKRLVLLLVLVSTCTGTAHAEEIRFRVRDGSPILVIRPQYRPRANDPTSDSIVGLQIYRRGTLLQTLPVGTAGMPAGFVEKSHGHVASLFQFMDCNFDGNKDIVMTASYGIMANTRFDVWLYQPSTGRFVFNPRLSDLSAPSFDNVQRVIHTRNQSGAGLYHTLQTLHWQGQQLVVDAEEDQAPLSTSSPIRVERIYRRRVGTRLRTWQIDTIQMDGDNYGKLLKRQRF